MGCCQSTSRDTDHHQHPSATQASSTSTASNTSAVNDSSAALRSPLPSTSASPAQIRTATRRRHHHHHHQQPPLAPSESHNKPLRRHGWMSRQPWTRTQLDREREAFFDTRVTGRPEIWHAIRMACETMRDQSAQIRDDDDEEDGHDEEDEEEDVGLATAQTILDAAGVTLPTGDLANGAYDTQGNLYTLPEHCICDPTNLSDTPALSSSPPDHETTSSTNSADDDEAEMRRAAKGKAAEGDVLTVAARLSDRGGPDVRIALGKQQAVRVLARRVQDEAGIARPRKIRIAYMGRMLKENEPLLGQGWSEGHVVNALVF